MIYITILRTQQLMSRTSFVMWRISNFYLYSTSCVWNSNSPLLPFVSNCCNGPCEKQHVKITWRINRIAVFSETISSVISSMIIKLFFHLYFLSLSLSLFTAIFYNGFVRESIIRGMSRARCAIIVFAISRQSLIIKA